MGTGLALSIWTVLSYVLSYEVLSYEGKGYSCNQNSSFFFFIVLSH